jgi:hypothetical protein
LVTLVLIRSSSSAHPRLRTVFMVANLCSDRRWHERSGGQGRIDRESRWRLMDTAGGTLPSRTSSPLTTPRPSPSSPCWRTRPGTRPRGGALPGTPEARQSKTHHSLSRLARPPVAHPCPTAGDGLPSLPPLLPTGVNHFMTRFVSGAIVAATGVQICVKHVVARRPGTNQSVLTKWRWRNESSDMSRMTHQDGRRQERESLQRGAL